MTNTENNRSEGKYCSLGLIGHSYCSVEQYGDLCPIGGKAKI